MKRSEIINLIANYFYENGVDADESMEEADTLLTALELRGMLPAYIESDLGYCERCDSAEWEDEDE